MDCGDNAYPITNNAAAKFSADNPGPPLAHGHRGGALGIAQTPPRGIMYGLGWHLGQEKNKTLVSYAPKAKDTASLGIYMAHHSRLHEVSKLYRHGLSCLFPGAADTLQAIADRDGVVAFSDLLDGVSIERPFANSLTATKSGFCNLQHRDKDHAPVVYGKWFEAKGDGKHWTFDPTADHNRTKGGEFVWGAFGIGVDFNKARGLVEIYWRGEYDFHGTLRSTDEAGYTRFGTSIQITSKGVNAMAKVWNVSELAASGHNIDNLAGKSRVTTAQQRVDKAERQAKQPKKRKGRA
ncbi:hypothetical protein DFH06DRAFT_1174225 [Mycena polygramma]|nr:hypothetical protein DFH06DRAFT_1174225 [Mycena polygramma]